MEPEVKHPFADVANELHAGERKRFVERMEGREAWEQTLESPEAGREVLLAMVDGQVERLEAVLGLHQQRELEACADRLAFEDTQVGEQLRRYQLACNRLLLRILDSLRKHRRELEREKGEATKGEKRRAGLDAPLASDPAPRTESIVPESSPLTDLLASMRNATKEPNDPAASGSPPCTDPSDPAPGASEDLPVENVTNEATKPAEGGHGLMRPTVLAVLVLLFGLGLTAAFAVSVERVGTTPSPQVHGAAEPSQLLELKAVRSIERDALLALSSGLTITRRSAELVRATGVNHLDNGPAGGRDTRCGRPAAHRDHPARSPAPSRPDGPR
jgi:hypothetical protein